VNVTPPSFTLDAIGATRVVKAAVLDQKGRPMTNASLSWSSGSAAATVTSLGGDSALVTAAAGGDAQVTARAGSAEGSTTVQVSQTVAGIQVVAGNGQTATVGTPVAIQPRVRVFDRLGGAVAGRQVTFTVFSGGGSVSPATVTTGADGTAAAAWTMGTDASALQQVVASVAGNSAAQAQFSATAVAGPPAGATIFAGNNQTGAAGAAVPTRPSVRVVDAFGNPVAGATVTFTVTTGGGSVTAATVSTGPDGVATVGSWTLGATPGANTLTVTFPGTAIGALAFAATGLPPVSGTATAAAGTNQAGMAGTAVPVRPALLVRDGGGNPVAGLTVTFTVTGGGGSVTGATATTDASGVATVGSWTLGTLAGPNLLSASVTAAGVTPNPVVFTAVGCSGGGGAGYAITLCITTPLTPSQRATFENAAARWATVITGDLPNATANVAAGTCGPSPSLNLDIDDLLIFAGIQDIDGPGAVLGSAGWCFRRSGGLPVIGLMRFDAADMDRLESGGQFGSVILHEMGHVLGISSSLWTPLGLLQNPSGSAPSDTYFSGPQAIAGFDAIGGSTYTGGQKVPVENTGGAGTANSHWRESVLANELMTGFLNSGVANPMSQLTVRSLADLGYSVNVAAAEPFSLTLSVRANREGTSGGLLLLNDEYTGPRYSLDRRGRITRLTRLR
jgi:hypothetical protein